jgi:phenylalanyl-tRNA synthetase alpha subunit
VYRRDTIDATHYPAFHQMEGVRVFEQAEWEAAGCTDVEVRQQPVDAVQSNPELELSARSKSTRSRAQLTQSLFSVGGGGSWRRRS